MSNKNLDEFVAKIINLANDQKLSDCSFLVGTDPKRLFYGHKIFLAMSKFFKLKEMNLIVIFKIYEFEQVVMFSLQCFSVI